MSKKRNSGVVITPSTSCRVTGCGRFLAWQPHPTRPGREIAVCDCRHQIHHNQSVAERPAAGSEKEQEDNGNTE